MFRLVNPEDEKQDRQKPGDDRHPENGAKVVGPQQHQPHRQKRPKKRPHRIQRLAQAKRRTANLGRGQVGHQCIARRAAYTLPGAINQARCKHHAGARSQGENRLGQRAQAVTRHGERLALAQMVAQHAGKDFHDQRSRFRQALDQADREGARAQRSDQKDRQQPVDKLRGGIHEKADEPQRPDACGNSGRRVSKVDQLRLEVTGHQALRI